MVWRSRKRKNRIIEIHPDEILLDAHNLPAFDRQQFEGRMERPISKKTLRSLGMLMTALLVWFAGQLVYLQVIKTDFYKTKSEQNSLDHIPVFADRGIIYDRNGVELAWNTIDPERTTPIRSYIQAPGFASMLGYVSYPAQDDNGRFWQHRVLGKDGVEETFDTTLAGVNGTVLVETDVSGSVTAENIIEDPLPGENVSLAIDARVQTALAQGIKDLAERSEYKGGAGAVMDINTGELLALTSFPEYDQSALSLGTDTALIKRYMQDGQNVFLNRMTQGLYTPGSIVKPFLALAALNEGVIEPNKVIYTTGELRVPNPYNPGQFTVFKDNADHGAVDMRKAIAISSNVYFYQIGGGFGTQRGLGIAAIERYIRMFGIGEKTGTDIGSEVSGTIPSVAWKARRFPKDPWRIGDTYNTSIGQYGFQVTPIQMLRATAGLASRGTLVVPTMRKYDGMEDIATTKLAIADSLYSVIHNAMRATVVEGTAQSLNTEVVPVAAKTGTAQIKSNTRVNSWVIGFFPSNKPRYAFVVIMEDGPKVSSGASHAFKSVVQLFANDPELLESIN